MAEITVKTVETILKNKNYKIKSISGNTITVSVNSDRYQSMKDLIAILKNLEAIHDPNAAGSSIGAVKIGKIKIMVKSENRSAGLDVESKAILTLQDAITSAILLNGGPITIKMPHRTVKGIVGVEKTSRNT